MVKKGKTPAGTVDIQGPDLGPVSKYSKASPEQYAAALEQYANAKSMLTTKQMAEFNAQSLEDWAKKNLTSKPVKKASEETPIILKEQIVDGKKTGILKKQTVSETLKLLKLIDKGLFEQGDVYGPPTTPEMLDYKKMVEKQSVYQDVHANITASAGTGGMGGTGGSGGFIHITTAPFTGGVSGVNTDHLEPFEEIDYAPAKYEAKTEKIPLTFVEGKGWVNPDGEVFISKSYNSLEEIQELESYDVSFKSDNGQLVKSSGVDVGAILDMLEKQGWIYQEGLEPSSSVTGSGENFQPVDAFSGINTQEHIEELKKALSQSPTTNPQGKGFKVVMKPIENLGSKKLVWKDLPKDNMAKIKDTIHATVEGPFPLNYIKNTITLSTKAPEKPSFKSTWTTAQAHKFINELRPHLANAGWGLGLTGSVLFDGASSKDLDLIVYPITQEEDCVPNLVPAWGAMKAFGMKQIKLASEVKKSWKARGSNDTKHVEIWNWNGKRVDIFFLA